MLAEKTYKSLKTMIYRRQLEPGERLIERKLSRKLGVSRVPLRESLLRLESEGLIRRVPYGASHVTDFTKHDIMEMYSMRLMFEPFATGLAALNHKPSLVRQLKDICHSMTRAAKAKKWEDLRQLDCDFHHAIVKASGHKRLFEAYAGCHIQICGLEINSRPLVAYEPPQQTEEEHLPLIEAIEKRDVRLAQETAYEHLKVSVDLIQKHFKLWLAPKQKSLFELPGRLGKSSLKSNGHG
jgi:DNA-binding GntR family transcriptional regulator